MGTAGIRLKEWTKGHWDLAIIPVIALLILWRNLFHELFLLDATPLQLPFLLKSLDLSSYSSMVTYQTLLHALKAVGLSQIAVQLLLVVGMMVAYLFLRRLMGRKDLAILAFAIFVFNPYLYSRLVAGQLGVVLAYLVMPAVVWSLLSLLDEPSSSSALKAALWFSISSAFQQQFFAINVIILLGIVVWKFSWDAGGARRAWRLLAKPLGIFVLATVLLNAYWLQAALYNPTMQSIDESHASFFAPKASDGISAVAKVVGMWGFWREDSMATTYKMLPAPLWYALTALLVALLLLGFAVYPRRREARVFMTFWWVGVILAVGVSHPYTAPIFSFLFRNAPFFLGFRDSHKLVALVALAYAILCPVAVGWLAHKASRAADGLHGEAVRKRASRAVAIILPALLLALVIAYTFPLLGLWGQVNPTAYPPSYAQTDAFLRSQESGGSLQGHIVYLPYYDYLTYNWTKKANPDGRIANPINKLVRPSVITDPGPWGARTALTREVGTCVDQKNTTCLTMAGVQYVLVDKCYIFFDAAQYSWLDAPVHQTSCTDTYELAAPQASITPLSPQRPPARFVIAIIVSIASLFTIVALLLLEATGSGADGTADASAHVAGKPSAPEPAKRRRRTARRQRA